MRSISLAGSTRAAVFLASLNVVIAGLAMPRAALAVDLYWDINGGAANTGTAAPGTWGIDAFWNDESSGTGGNLTATTAAGDNVFFSSGNNFTDPFTVTVDGAQAVNSITFEEGGITLSGGTGLTVGEAITKLSGVNTVISTPLLMPGDLAITNAGAGTLTVGAISAVGNANAVNTLSLVRSGTGGTITIDGIIADASGASANKAAVTVNTSGSTTTFTAANTYTGATRINSGSTLTLSGTSGSIANSSAVFVNGGTLNLDNSAGNANRIGDTTGVTLNRSTLSLNRNTSANTTENIGALTLVSNGTVTLTTANSRVTTLNAASLVRDGAATGLIRGTGLGGPTSTTNINVVTLNSLSGLTQVGTQTAATGFNASRTATNLKIVPYVVADTAGNNFGISFATYDVGADGVLGGVDTGFRPLNASELVTFATKTANDQNVRDGAATLSGNTVMNSLVLNASGTLSGNPGAQLTVTSGALGLLSTTNLSMTITGFDQLNLGQAATDHAEAVIFVTGNTSNTASFLTINSTINPGQAIGLTKAGYGNLTINGAQTFTGALNVTQGKLTLNGSSNQSATIISGATLEVGASSAGAWGSSNSPITINDGGTLTVNAGVNFGGGQINLNDGGTISLNGLGSNNPPTTYFTNRVVVSGNAQIRQSSSSGSGNKTVIGPVTMTDGAVLTTVRVSSSTNGFGLGVVTLEGDATFNTTATLPDDNHYLHIAQITGTGDFTKTGAGELWLALASFNPSHTTSASSTFVGDTHILQGNLRMGRVNALPTDTTVFVNSGARFDMSTGNFENARASFDQTIAGLNDGPNGGGVVTANATTINVGAKTLTLSGSGVYDFSGVISNNTGSGTATLALVKSGSGTQTLSGINTYTGATTVSGGKLLVDGSLAAASAVTVGNGATLGGSGVVNGSVLANAGSTVAPGNSPGSLVFGSYDQQAGSLLDIEIGNGDPAGFVLDSVEPYDRLVVTGLTSLAGDLQVSLIDGMTLEDGQLFGIVDRQGGSAAGLDMFANFAEGDLVLSDAAANLYITYFGDITDNSVSLTGGNDIVLFAIGSLTVPEPATIGLWTVIGVAVLAGAAARNRRARRA